MRALDSFCPSAQFLPVSRSPLGVVSFTVIFSQGRKVEGGFMILILSREPERIRAGKAWESHLRNIQKEQTLGSYCVHSTVIC